MFWARFCAGLGGYGISVQLNWYILEAGLKLSSYVRSILRFPNSLCIMTHFYLDNSFPANLLGVVIAAQQVSQKYMVDRH
jgi:hypothetical protein